MSGVSIIPSDISYVQDGSKSLDFCKILAIKEYSKSEKTTTTLFEISVEERKTIIESINTKNNMRMIHNDVTSLKQLRSKFLANPQNEKLKIKYEKGLGKFLGILQKSMYQPFMIEEVLKRLLQQREILNDDNAKGLITREIEEIKAVAQQRGIDVSNYFTLNKDKTNIQISSSGTAALQAPAIPLTADPLPPIFSNLKKELISTIRRINLSVNTYFSQLSHKMTQPKPAKHKKTTKVKNTNNSPRKSGQTARSSAPKKKQSAPTKKTSPKYKTVSPQQQSTQPKSEPPKRYYITNEHRRRNVRLINDKEKQSPRPITKKRNQNHSHDD